MAPAIVVDNLGKRYRIGGPADAADYGTFREGLMALAAAPLRRLRGIKLPPPAAPFWALRDVSFEAAAGETLGVIGRNGAGKSTLLKVLSRIVKPTTGSARLRGRVGSLLEVGTGFHPELTGRENIYLNGSILGMSRREIANRFDDIVAFSEVGAFLDTPVKRYSSGMYVRLAFAVAANLEPEILIVDEVLAVGDVAFQKKCLGRMQTLSEGGRTVLFVSHNMPAVRAFTQRCLYLRDGQVVAHGATPEIIDRYLRDAWDQQGGTAGAGLDYYRRDRNRRTAVRVEAIIVEGGDGCTPPLVRSGDDFTVRIRCRSERHLPGLYCSLWLTNQQGERVATFFCADADFLPEIHPGEQELRCRIRGLPLSPGRYTVSVGVNEGISTMAFDVILDYPALNVFMPEVDNGALEWPFRPWGCLHWKDVSWEAGPARTP